MFVEFLRKGEFYKKYIQLFNMRSTITNLEMEDIESEITSPSRTIEMYNNLNAFTDLLENNPEKISPYDVIDVADNVNKNINYFDKGFRKTQVEVACSKHFFPIAASKVPEAMYSLFNAYHNIWNVLPVYEKEARFHIELVRIQPFEDGNKRTARIVTNFNLCKQNKAPVIISGNETNKYFEYIDNYDVENFAKFLQEKSKEEFENMLNLYKTMYGDNFIEDTSDFLVTDNDVKIYEFIREPSMDGNDSSNLESGKQKVYKN